MVDGCQNNIMAYQDAIPNLNSPLILKMTAGIDEYIFPNGNIFSEVRIERRKQSERIVYAFACQPAHNLPQLFRGMVLVIHLHPKPDCLLTKFIKQLFPFRTFRTRPLLFIEFCQNILYSHSNHLPVVKNPVLIPRPRSQVLGSHLLFPLPERMDACLIAQLFQAADLVSSQLNSCRLCCLLNLIYLCYSDNRERAFCNRPCRRNLRRAGVKNVSL